ncbi:hypothetical protein ANO14919_095360 [Xylariales sp. No.14919]|nr:hypothetical protein ANO14919_095360 [Xylariales sp. No.14919]
MYAEEKSLRQELPVTRSLPLFVIPLPLPTFNKVVAFAGEEIGRCITIRAEETDKEVKCTMTRVLLMRKNDYLAASSSRYGVPEME